MTTTPLKLLILGAHPDDAEFKCGGIMSQYRSLGYAVKMISVTNGASGHHEMSGPPLTERRRAELAASAATIGAVSEVWEFPDGALEPSLEVRWKVIAEIRSYAPDLVLTHRTNDYHPDHRAVGQAVQDASYLVTVPPVVPTVPILQRDPVVAYMNDHFTKPVPLAGDVVFDITDQMEQITDMLCCHVSQVFEWLPYNQRILGQLPKDAAGRRNFVRSEFRERARKLANRYRQELIATYGPQRGERIEFAEVYEISEYATRLDADARKRLFPFLP